MITWELILIASVAGIFIIVLRRLPKAIHDVKTGVDSSPDSVRDEMNAPKLAPKAIISKQETRNSTEATKTKTLGKTESIQKETEPNVIETQISESEGEKAYREKDYPRARLIYSGLAKQDPTNPKIYNRLGAICMELERLHEARDAFRSALKYGDQVASRHANLGMAEYALGHRLTAVRYIKRALAMDPKNSRYQELLELVESDRQIS